MNGIHTWTTYFSERCTPRLSLVVITGIGATGVLIGRNPFQLTPFLVSCFTLLYIAFLLRITNDVNDYNKDRIAFPNRALPRGLVGKKEAIWISRMLQLGLFGYFILLFMWYFVVTKAMLVITTIYLWCLLKDGHAKQWLKRHPLLHGFFQQGLIIPITLLVISLGRPEYTFSLTGWAYASLLFGAFFTFDICRKLDPYSHPISLYYIHYYGFRFSYFIVCSLLLISALGAFGMGVYFWLWPCEIAVGLLLTILFKNPKQFALVEMAAGLSLMAHAWAGIFQWI